MTGAIDPTRITYPDENRQVLLVERPTGIPQPEHFRLATAPRPQLGPGEFLVRNIYLSVDPAQRGIKLDAIEGRDGALPHQEVVEMQVAMTFDDPTALTSGLPMRAQIVSLSLSPC